MTLKITNKNILGWLALASKILPLEEDEFTMLDKFLKRTDTVRRQKEIDLLFGADNKGEEIDINGRCCNV